MSTSYYAIHTYIHTALHVRMRGFAQRCAFRWWWNLGVSGMYVSLMALGVIPARVELWHDTWRLGSV